MIFTTLASFDEVGISADEFCSSKALIVLSSLLSTPRLACIASGPRDSHRKAALQKEI